MDFEFTDEQRLLRDSVDRLLADHYGFAQRRGYLTEPEGWSTALWSRYAEQGLLNGWLKALGFPAVHWLQDPRLALPSIMAMDVWASVGYYAILILAGRKTLPVEQLEAARLEGMRALAIERRIILPHVKPVILFVVLLNTVRSFQIFIEVFVLTRGGPLESTLTLVYHLYERAFYHFEMGYACAPGASTIETR